MTEEHEVKHEALIPYCEAAIKLANKFKRFYIGHVPRYENVYADALASLAATLAVLPRSCKRVAIRC